MNNYIESHHRATVMSAIKMIKVFIRSIIYPFIGLLVDFSLMTAFISVGMVIIVVTLVSKVEEDHLIG